jgi:predicted nucleic acid-binding protein
MPEYLLDTGVLIRHVRNRPGFRELLRRLRKSGKLHASAVSRVEILRGMREHERERTYDLLNSVRTHSLDRITADVAGELIRNWQARGITLDGPDAVIGASALILGTTLVTLNPRHFPSPELSVLVCDEAAQVRPALDT